MTPASALGARPEGKAWHSQSAEEALAQLASTSEGLSAQKAAQRLATYGPNELKEGKRISPLQIFLGQFKSLIIWILIVAGVISGLLGERVDAIAILAIVVLNAVVGFYQEFKAEKSIAALKKMTAPQAKVRRDGTVTSIPASGIVAGDILALEAGDLVAADARLLEAASLRCIESALTGESEAVAKQPATLEPGDIPLGDRKNMVFMGTSVAAGTGQAVVLATAMKTELGRIARLIAEAGADEGTPLQQKLTSFGRILIWVTLGIVALLFGLGLLRGTKPFELFMTSVSLAVAAVPEGLPAVVTVALALGVLRMSRRRALVRKLTGCLTAGVTFAVYVYVLKVESLKMARTYAFAVLVFAELLRSFGARSETKPVWRISLFTNINLILGRFLKTSSMPLADCFLLLAAGAIPLLTLEMVKVMRHALWRRKRDEPLCKE